MWIKNGQSVNRVVCLHAVGVVVWFFFSFPEETGLSVSLRLVAREYDLASMSMLPSVSHSFHFLHSRPFCFLIRDTDAVSSIPLPFFIWPQTIGLGTQRCMQIRRRSQCRLAPACQRQRSAALHSAASASHSSHFHCDLRAYYTAWRKSPITLRCTINHQREHSGMNDRLSIRGLTDRLRNHQQTWFDEIR